MRNTENHRRIGTRAALLAGSVFAFGALVGANPVTAAADTGDEDETGGSADPSTSQSITSNSGPITSNSLGGGSIVVDVPKPIGSDLSSPGTTPNPGLPPSDVWKTEPKYDLNAIREGRDPDPNAEWIPDIAVDGERNLGSSGSISTPPPPLVPQTQEFYDLYPRR